MSMEFIRAKVWLLMGVLVISPITQSCQPEEEGPFIVVETGAIEEIGPTFCVVGGAIDEIGLDGVVQHGFVWSDSPHPTLETGHLSELGMSSTVLSFSYTIYGLSPNTTYYVRAYGSSMDQNAYGMEKSFTTTSPTVPELHTLIAFGVGANHAFAGGLIVHDGGSDITSRGVCWSTVPKATVNDNCSVDGAGEGDFESDLMDLEPYTVYFYRAYAINSLGTAYGEQFGLITLWDNSIILDVDGNEYGTIQIGEQVWMAENLKALHFADGTPIQLADTEESWGGLLMDESAYCFYDNSSQAHETYGSLYNWSAAMNGAEGSSDEISEVQGVCPDGWHLPSDAEWKQLEVQMGLSALRAGEDGWRGWDEGGKLKQTGTTLWVEPNEFGTNESGFSAIPGGFRDTVGIFQFAGKFTAFWSTTGNGEETAWIRGLHAGRGEILRAGYPQKDGLSVRCIMDY